MAYARTWMHIQWRFRDGIKQVPSVHPFFTIAHSIYLTKGQFTVSNQYN